DNQLVNALAEKNQQGADHVHHDAGHGNGAPPEAVGQWSGGQLAQSHAQDEQAERILNLVSGGIEILNDGVERRQVNIHPQRTEQHEQDQHAH
ncbi:hypothetical protein ElyMa_000447800, partial [Elysia marginata]